MSAMFGVGAMLVPPEGAGRAGSPCPRRSSWSRRSGVAGRSAACPCRRWPTPRSSGPLAPTARLGGALLLIGVTVVVGVVLAALARRAWWPAAVGAGVVVALGWPWPRRASGPRPPGEIDAALVQGGGPQGTQASDTDEPTWCSSAISTPPSRCRRDAISSCGPRTSSTSTAGWPVARRRTRSPRSPAGSTPRSSSGSSSRRTTGSGTPPSPSIPTAPSSTATRRSRRVPFGEYVPLRWLVDPFGADEPIPRDAVVGTGPGRARHRAGPAGRRDLVGGVLRRPGPRRDRQRRAASLLNPTNGSSYSGTIVQTQQVAASRLRAIETGRWVAPGRAHRVHRDRHRHRRGAPAHGDQRAGGAVGHGRDARRPDHRHPRRRLAPGRSGCWSLSPWPGSELDAPRRRLPMPGASRTRWKAIGGPRQGGSTPPARVRAARAERSPDPG